MGWLFRKREDEETLVRINSLDTSLTRSFLNVKDDIARLQQWIAYLYQRDVEHHSRMEQMQQAHRVISQQKNGVPADRIAALEEQNQKGKEEILTLITELDRQIQVLANAQQVILAEMEKRQHEQAIAQTPVEEIVKKKESFRDRLAARIAKNSKEYIKSLITSFIKKYEKISALQLREMIVEEQHLCSKSSFYRMLEEIEKEAEVTVVNQGKEKYYIATVTKQL
jgi:hypothetical protein